MFDYNSASNGVINKMGILKTNDGNNKFLST